jgi:hypothetical protein
MTTSFNFLKIGEFEKLTQLEKIDYLKRAGPALGNLILPGPRTPTTDAARRPPNPSSQ